MDSIYWRRGIMNIPSLIERSLFSCNLEIFFKIKYLFDIIIMKFFLRIDFNEEKI